MPDRKKCIAIAVGSSWLVTVAVCIVLSIAMLYVDLSDSILDIVSVLILSLACYFSAYISTQLHRKNGLLQGLICGLVIYFSVFLLSLIFNGPSFTLIFGVKLFTCTAFGIVGGIKGINSRKTNRP